MFWKQKKTLRNICELAFALGQSKAILEKVERGELHPAMAAFGLWRDDPDLEDLADEIAEDRLQTPGPSDLEP
jgi:hypothetical protein